MWDGRRARERGRRAPARAVRERRTRRAVVLHREHAVLHALWPLPSGRRKWRLWVVHGLGAIRAPAGRDAVQVIYVRVWCGGRRRWWVWLAVRVCGWRWRDEIRVLWWWTRSSLDAAVSRERGARGDWYGGVRDLFKAPGGYSRWRRTWTTSWWQRRSATSDS